MPADDFAITAEFCATVGAHDLLSYLGVTDPASSEEARAKLKARRKFMQGMQSNPKYKGEALFLIRNYASLNSALEDIPAYLTDARRRAESVHLPVLEMTIRGILATGTAPTPDQLEFLQTNARELGIRPETFDESLQRIAVESGITLPLPSPPPAAAPSPPPVEPRVEAVLDIAPPPEPEGVEPAVPPPAPPPYTPPPLTPEPAPVAASPPPSATPVSTRQADVRTIFLDPGEPAPVQAPSEVRTMLIEGAGPAAPRLEILGDDRRRIRLGRRIPEIRIRNGGAGGLSGTVTTDVPWLKAVPQRLDPSAPEQTILVRISHKRLPDGPAVGSVVIATDGGERARVWYEVRRGPPAALIVAALFIPLTLVVGAGILLYRILGGNG